MDRIFKVLASFAIAIVLGTLLLGLSLRTVNIRDPIDDRAQRMATVHRLSGVAAAICVVLVNSIVVTYFIGTGRWCKEVSETYSLDRSFVARSSALKRKTFPWAVMNMLIAVAIIALGGAGDPAGTVHWTPPPGLTWTNVHFMAAAAGLMFFGWASLAELQNIRANHAVVTDVMDTVKRIRQERGLT